MEESSKEKQKKKIYRKPEISRVKLVPSEAVLSVCKTGILTECPPPGAINCNATITGS